MSGSRLNSKGAASLFQKGPVTYPNDRKGPAPPGRIGTAEKPELSVNEASGKRTQSFCDAGGPGSISLP